MKLNQLSPPKGAVKKRKRIGRGSGSGHGGTSTKGHKGQQSRAGGGSHPWFEGGQMPLQRRLPKRGFRSLNKAEMQIVNLGSLVKLGSQENIAPLSLKNAGLIKYADRPVKVLGQGEVKSALSIQAHAFSKSALQKIQAAGGKAEIIKE
ncbi:MAG: 50S ribosomal protein L15 [candidate division Zixibacteria bacterium RBG_16_50_21]|nr:MAG: 50S ribosomal protein L15 [candidate division Zixibacteria bacterium RBG_16_50_21]